MSVFLPILLSSHVFAIVDLSNSAPSKAFTQRPGYSSIEESSTILINNMPAVRSQDSFGTCFGCSSATIAQKFICDNSNPKNSNCSDLPREKMISQLSMVAWADADAKNISFKSIGLDNQSSGKSTGSRALKNSMNLFSFMPESCYPFDQLVNKYGSNVELANQMILRIEKFYKANKQNKTAADVPCLDCIEYLNQDLNATFTKSTLLTALSKETFGEFLYSLIFQGCEEMHFRKKPNFGSFPESGQKAKKTEALDKIKKILESQKPVQIENLCIRVNTNKPGCNSGHALVVTGYRNICKDNTFKDCKPQIKVQNCWGQDWQNANNNGWVDAESLIDNINYGKDDLLEADISWLY